MPSAYLQSGELTDYGAPGATAQQIQQASTIIDSYLGRPEGLVWSPDSSGNPCYMAAMAPALSFTATGSVAPGQNVVVPVNGPTMMSDLVGEVLVLDRANSGQTEACVITAVTPGHLTLQAVINSHTSGFLLEAGMSILEERALPAKRSVTRLSRPPIARLLSGLGRYAFGRRSDQVAGLFNDANLLAAIQSFGGPPMWLAFDVTNPNMVSNSTGEVWVPAGLLLAYYSEVRIRYVAGYPVGGLPPMVKQACATLIAKIVNFGDADPSFKLVQAGGTKLERFSDTIMDTDTKDALEPFKTKLFY